jgi:hypothetical protein
MNAFVTVTAQQRFEIVHAEEENVGFSRGE